MTELLLGPVLRHVDRTSATVWVETDGRCEVTVDCGEATGSARTWCVFGHHYALVTVSGLVPGSARPYTVRLDGERCWPLARAPHPPSVLRTLPGEEDDRELRIVFGSCRKPGSPEDDGTGGRPLAPDALGTLARRLMRSPGEPPPDALLLLGDQVYADETSPAMRNLLERRRDPSAAPGGQIADFEEYTMLYSESWRDPRVRWLLSTVPSAMIFDDHDVIDDWNTSHAWREDMAGEPWWAERVTGAFMSYWIHQHLGNLDPASLAVDPVYAAVREAGEGEGGDAGPLLREFALSADAEAEGKDGTRWSFRRDFGRTRLLMIDCRAGRVLTRESRAMIGPAELEWITEQADEGGYDHLLIGTSLPWLLPHGVHDAEAWNEALCDGVRGRLAARAGEWIRRAGDLEHWAAFRGSFEALSALIGRIALHGPASGDGPPATVCVLSGDVHHGYAAQARWPGEDRTAGTAGGGGAGGPAHVYQLTCSPVHNSVPAAISVGFRFGWSGAARRAGRLLARHARLEPLPVMWDKLGGPWFGNQLMTLTLRGRRAGLTLERTEGGRRGRRARLRCVGHAVLRHA